MKKYILLSAFMALLSLCFSQSDPLIYRVANNICGTDSVFVSDSGQIAQVLSPSEQQMAVQIITKQVEKSAPGIPSGIVNVALTLLFAWLVRWIDLRRIKKKSKYLNDREKLQMLEDLQTLGMAAVKKKWLSNSLVLFLLFGGVSTALAQYAPVNKDSVIAWKSRATSKGISLEEYLTAQQKPVSSLTVSPAAGSSYTVRPAAASVFTVQSSGTETVTPLAGSVFTVLPTGTNTITPLVGSTFTVRPVAGVNNTVTQTAGTTYTIDFKSGSNLENSFIESNGNTGVIATSVGNIDNTTISMDARLATIQTSSYVNASAWSVATFTNASISGLGSAMYTSMQSCGCKDVRFVTAFWNGTAYVGWYWYRS